MSKRSFSILLVVSILVALAVLVVPSRTGRDATSVSSEFLPELAPVVNELDLVRISSDGGAEVVTLERSEGAWVVQEFHNYPADWAALRPLLADLSQAEVVEEKTANPEYYDRLGVEDPMQEGAQSRLIEFPRLEAVPSVIVGNRAQGRDGHYLRRSDQERSVLVDRAITLPLDASGWLDGAIVDVSEDRVILASVTHADGERVEIERASTEITDFTLVNRPDGRETRSAWTVNQLASALSALTLDGVAPADQVEWGEALAFSLETEDGLQINAWFAEDEDDRWVRVEAAAAEGSDEAVFDEAAAINRRVNGWAYQIPLYKHDAVNKRMVDLLAEEEEE